MKGAWEGHELLRSCLFIPVCSYKFHKLLYKLLTTLCVV